MLPLVVVVAYKKWLMRPRFFAGAIDLCCFYRGRLLTETYVFCDL